MGLNDTRRQVLAVNELADHASLSTDIAVPARAMAIGAHPDDIEFGCGATLAKWAQSGCKLHHLVLTDGAKGSWDPDQDPTALVVARRDEQREAARRLGGSHVEFLGFPDGDLRNGVLEQEEVCRAIRLVRPDVVLSHDPWRRYRLHPDHRHAGFIVTDALVAARDPHFFADLHLPPHRPSVLLLWEADVANHVESVEGFASAKTHALLAHRSQYESALGITPARQLSGDTARSRNQRTSGEKSDAEALAQRIEEQLARHGALASVAQGESFHIITEL